MDINSILHQRMHSLLPTPLIKLIICSTPPLPSGVKVQRRKNLRNLVRPRVCTSILSPSSIPSLRPNKNSSADTKSTYKNIQNSIPKNLFQYRLELLDPAMEAPHWTITTSTMTISRYWCLTFNLSDTVWQWLRNTRALAVQMKSCSPQWPKSDRSIMTILFSPYLNLFLCSKFHFINLQQKEVIFLLN